MDNGLKDFIEELREYGNARKGELAGMLLEAANRLEEMAIEALKQEPCEDAISRQAVLDLINADWKYEGLEEPVSSLPSVTPKQRWAKLLTKER